MAEGITGAEQVRSKALGFNNQEAFDGAVLLANTYNRMRILRTWHRMDQAVRVPPGQGPFQGSQAGRTIGRAMAATGVPQFVERVGGESDESARRQLFWNSMLPMVAIEFMFNMSGKQTTDREREVFLRLFPNAVQSSNVNDAFFDGIMDTLKRGIESRSRSLAPEQRKQVNAHLTAGAAENSDLLKNRTLEFLNSQDQRIPIEALPPTFRQFTQQARAIEADPNKQAALADSLRMAAVPDGQELPADLPVVPGAQLGLQMDPTQLKARDLESLNYLKSQQGAVQPQVPGAGVPQAAPQAPAQLPQLDQTAPQNQQLLDFLQFNQ